MAVNLKAIAEAEMQAYDALPTEVRRVFDAAPRKVSVIQTMGLPGVRKAYRDMDTETFAAVLSNHLAQQAASEAIHA